MFVPSNCIMPEGKMCKMGGQEDRAYILDND